MHPYPVWQAVLALAVFAAFAAALCWEFYRFIQRLEWQDPITAPAPVAEACKRDFAKELAHASVEYNKALDAMDHVEQRYDLPAAIAVACRWNDYINQLVIDAKLEYGIRPADANAMMELKLRFRRARSGPVLPLRRPNTAGIRIVRERPLMIPTATTREGGSEAVVKGL